jgi:hypothetical protein
MIGEMQAFDKKLETNIKSCDLVTSEMHLWNKDAMTRGNRKALVQIDTYLKRIKFAHSGLEDSKFKIENRINDYNKLLATCKTKEQPAEKIPQPVLAVENGKASSLIDSCLAGSWRTESVQRIAKTGGAGIIMNIHINGEVTINYSGMQELKQVIINRVISTDSWSGIARGHIMIDSGLVKVISVEKSGLSGKETDQYGTKSLSLSGLGPVFEGGGKTYQLKYSCDGTKLIIKVTIGSNVLGTYTFKPEKKEL